MLRAIMPACHSLSSARPSPTHTAFLAGVRSSAAAPALMTLICCWAVAAPSVPNRTMRFPSAPGICITVLSFALPEKSPAFKSDEIAPSRDSSSALALFSSCEPVMRMRESALMFNRFAEDAVKSILAPKFDV